MSKASNVIVQGERLIVFLKAPRLGLVKTRLAATIGPSAALAAYQLLVNTLLEGLREIQTTELRYAPDDGLSEIQPWLYPGWIALPQGNGDLGERLQTAFKEAFESGARYVVVIGSDCPHVTAEDIKSAWKALQSHDVVIGPATDGGYWLIGLTRPQPELFKNMLWSIDTVSKETLQRAKFLDLKVYQLRYLTDIDTETDWNLFIAKQNSAC